MNIFKELGIREGRDRANEEVLYNIASVYSLMDRVVSQFLTRYEMNPAKFNILLVVKHIGKERGLSQNEISRRLLVTTSNITRMLDKLEDEGYLERTHKDGDRRVKIVKITEKGSSILDTIWPDYKRTVDSLIGNILSDDDKRNLNRSLEKMKYITKEG